jgi:hypothetical protein
MVRRRRELRGLGRVVMKRRRKRRMMMRMWILILTYR